MCVSYVYCDIAKMIDHSLLSPAMTAGDLERGCRIGVEYEVASVCVMPYFLKRAAGILAGSGVKASTTVGFPHGGHTTAAKLAEARQALDDGGEELDMVASISAAVSEDWRYVRDEIGAICELVHGRGQKLKVIFENCYLTDGQKIELCRICGEIGVDWVKTSTGYGSGGASLDDVKLMREHSPAAVQVKAAGGIRDLDALLAFRAAGATRIGASRTTDILDECKRRLGP
jgi:deoxyribose-phosphate aldolase